MVKMTDHEPSNDILDANAIISKFLKNKKETHRICTAADTEIESIRNKQLKIKNDAETKIEALEKTTHDKRTALDKQAETVEVKKKKTIEPLCDQIGKVKQLISLLKMAERFEPVENIKNVDVRPYDSSFLKWLGYIHRDDFLKIRLLIAGNSKPKNKYTLMAYGRCVFKESLIKRPYMYGGPHLNDSNQGFSIKYELQSLPSVEEIKEVSKRKDILKSFIEKVEVLKKEYLEVTKNYKLSDFSKILLAYQLSSATNRQTHETPSDLSYIKELNIES